MHLSSRSARPLSSSHAIGVVAGALALTVSMSACSSGGSSDKVASASSSATKAAPVTVAIASDVANGTAIGLAQPVKVTATGGSVATVAVTDAKGKAAAGSFDAATGTWQPTDVLTAKAVYTVSATAKGADGVAHTQTRKLTTDDGSTTTAIYMSDPGKVTSVGNAQPIVVTFTQPVPYSERKAVEARFKVSDTSNVEGAWRWLNGARMDYRPRTFWPLHDKVTYSGSLRGLPIGRTQGAGTLKGSFSVDSDLQATYDRTERRFVVTQGGKTVKTFLSGAGKPGLETPSGSMVVLGKMSSVQMRSCSVGLGCNPTDKDYYDETITHAVQITPSGIFVHAAPGDRQLGRVDSSHGCIHLSLADATWFFDKALPGTLVKVTGTINPVKITNGDGDWNLTWEQWIS